MIVLLNIEYLLKEVNDATIWLFVLWNQLPLQQVVNDTLQKSWKWLYTACKQSACHIDFEYVEQV